MSAIAAAEPFVEMQPVSAMPRDVLESRFDELNQPAASPVNPALRCKMVRRCGHEDFVVPEGDRGTIGRMKAVLFDLPRCPSVAADAESNRCGGHHDV